MQDLWVRPTNEPLVGLFGLIGSLIGLFGLHGCGWCSHDVFAYGKCLYQ